MSGSTSPRPRPALYLDYLVPGPVWALMPPRKYVENPSIAACMQSYAPDGQQGAAASVRFVVLPLRGARAVPPSSAVGLRLDVSGSMNLSADLEPYDYSSADVAAVLTDLSVNKAHKPN